LILPLRLPLLKRVRRSLPVAWLGIALLAVQALATADHLSALAALAGGGVPGGRLGILGLCSPVPPSGMRTDGGQSAPRRGSAAACPVCSAASASGNAICGEAAPLVVPSWIAAGDHIFVWLDSHVSAPVLRFGAVRGPPVPIVV
jgi:hypothetical protein